MPDASRPLIDPTAPEAAPGATERVPVALTEAALDQDIDTCGFDDDIDWAEPDASA